MRHIKFDPLKLHNPAHKDFWDKWLRRADAATQRIIECQKNGTTIEFEEKIWKDLEDWLTLNVFFGFCAYCESAVVGVAPPDAEHYRPKKMVRVRLTGHTHPGYFWLAYNWKNILPSCLECNRGRGKGNFFPVERVHIVTYSDKSNPDDLDQREGPLLLHPYRDKPREHLAFGVAGLVSGLTPKGKESVTTYGLNREGLQDQRAEAQRAAWQDFGLALVSGNNKLMEEILEKYDSGRKRFSAACLAFIEHSLENAPRPKAN